MSLSLSLILFVTSANLLLGLWVWLKNPQDKINQYFGLFSLAVAAWSLSNGFVASYAATNYGYLWARFAFASASIMPLAFLLFVSVFPSTLPVLRRPLLLVFLTGGAAAFILSLTSAVVKDTTSANGTLRVLYGPLYHIVALYMISCFASSLLVLTRKLQATKGIENLQVRYLFLGFLTAGIGATITNLLLPLVFATSYFSQYGPLFSILMMGVIAHSIIRYRLMNIRLVIRRGIAYLLAVATASSVFLAFVSLTSTLLLASGSRDLPLEVELSFVLLIALLFQPLNRYFQAWLGRYFFREPYNYQTIIREISRTMGTLLDLQSLLNYICEIVARTIQPEALSIYIRGPQGTSYQRMSTRSIINGSPEIEDSLSSSSPLPRLLASRRTYLLRGDVRPAPNEPARDAITDLIRLQGEMTFPILYEEQLTGFLIVGCKRSGDPYFSEDIDLLSTLVGQAAIAIKNAQLYQEMALVNEYVANIVATMESGVAAIDANGKVALFNPAAERITGLSMKSILSAPASGLPAALAHPLTATLTDGQSRTQAETTIPGGAGRYTPVSGSTHALRDRLGNILGAVVVFSDLSRLKELERERRRAERLASFGALASGIAHEIKNPLVAIRTFAELLPERFADEDFREDFSKVVIREIARIDDLVSRLRDIAAKAPHQVGAVDLREPITETIILLRAQLEQSRITAHCDFRDPAPNVAVEEPQLKQLFLNLFLNAIEAIGSDGDITIQVRRKEVQGTGWIVAEVSDTGPGIPESVTANIFEPFFTTKPRGTGLGLAICRGITDAHRGTIRAENNAESLGTTIVVEFPAAANAPLLTEERALRQ